MTEQQYESLMGRVLALQHVVATLVFAEFRNHPEPVAAADEILESHKAQMEDVLADIPHPLASTSGLAEGYAQAVDAIKSIAIPLLERIPSR